MPVIRHPSVLLKTAEPPIYREDTMDRRDAILDRITEKEDLLYDLKQAGEWDAARAVQQDLADLYHALEMAA